MTNIVLFKSESEESHTGDPYISALKKLNFNAFIIPTLKFHFKNQEHLVKELCNPGKYNSLIFTSPRAVKAVHDVRAKISLQDWTTKPTFCVGKTTSKLATTLLNLNCFGEESGNSSALANFIIDFAKENSTFIKDKGDAFFLFITGEKHRDDIPRILGENKFSVQKLVCYEALPNADLAANYKTLVNECGHPDIIVLFSPSIVSPVTELLTEHINVEAGAVQKKYCIAIGPSTLQKISETKYFEKNKNWSIYASPSPDPEGVVEILKKIIE